MTSRAFIAIAADSRLPAPRLGARRVIDRPIVFADPTCVRRRLATLPVMLMATDTCRT